MGRKAKEIIDLSSTLADIWRVLSEEEREQIKKNARFVHYKKNETIYIEEEQPLDLMCLLKGKVKIYKSGVGGRTQIIRMIRPIQNFGPCFLHGNLMLLPLRPLRLQPFVLFRWS